MTGSVEPNDVVSGPGGPPGTGATNRAEPDPSIPADAETQAMGADEADGAADVGPFGGAAAPASSFDCGSDAASAPTAASTSSIEDLVADLERTARERDEYLDALSRNQAEFENARKRMIKQQSDNVDRAGEVLVEKLLPVLDACDGAVRHGATEVGPIFAALLGTLEKEGLERIDPAGQPFDPNQHEAVMHEPADEAGAGTVVTDVMRPGYSWKGRIVRAAMVKVRG